MSDYIVSARKYRPQAFDEVVGQAHVAKTLSNALSNDQLAQAFLFCGPRGIGKTTCARILARVLNCEKKQNAYTACGEGDVRCENCKQDVSFNIFELDAASNNSVEHIRSLIDQVRIRPQAGAYKIFIIDEVHMLSTAAFNAFLKTLEEPPPYAVFILATTEKHKIIPTILSRCQIFNFKRISVPDIVGRLKNISSTEGITIEEEGLQLIAQKADGALRDALSIYDKVVSSSSENISYRDVADSLNELDEEYYFKIVDAAIKEDATTVILSLNDIFKNGFEAELFIQGLSQHFRNLRLASDQRTRELLEVSDKQLERFFNQAQLMDESYILNALSILNKADLSLPMSNQKVLHTEMALTKIIYQNKIINFSDTEGIKKKTTDTSPLKKEASATINLKATNPTPSQTKEESEKAPIVKAQKNPVSSPVSAPRISTDINQLLSDIKAEEAAKLDECLGLTQSNMMKVWKEYADSLNSSSLKTSLEIVELELDGQSVNTYIPSSISREHILQEKKLVETIRSRFNNQEITLNIVVDASRFPNFKTAQRKKVLSDKDKLALMETKNPLVKSIVEKFSLKVDK